MSRYAVAMVARRAPIGWSSMIIAAILLVALTALTVLVARHPGLNPVDRTVDDLLHASHESRRFTLFRFLGYSGSALAVGASGLLLCLVTAWMTRSWALAALCVVAPVLAVGIELLLKELVARPAPRGGLGLSYPSGHVTGSSALATAAVIVGCTVWSTRRDRAVAGVLCAGYVVVVGVARIVVGAHYATDVLGGALLGVSTTLALWSLLVRPDGNARLSKGARR